MNRKNKGLTGNENVRVTRNNSYKNDLNKTVTKDNNLNKKEANNSLKRPGLLDPHPTPTQKKPYQNAVTTPKNNFYDAPKNQFQKNFNSVKNLANKENVGKSNFQRHPSFSIDKTYMTPMQNFENDNGANRSANRINNANPRFHHNFFNQNSSIMKKYTNNNFNGKQNQSNDNFKNYGADDSKSQASKIIMKPQKDNEVDTIIITCCINDMLEGFTNISHIKLFEIFAKVASPVVKNDQAFMEFILKVSRFYLSAYEKF